MQEIFLTENWQVKNCHSEFDLLKEEFTNSHGWLAAKVPGVVHEDLLAAKLIADPFVGMNEREVQWVGETNWLYRCTFTLSASFLQAPATYLCLDGLDTIATVWLNGTKILSSDNMFVPYRLPVKSLLNSEENSLFILFESPLKLGKKREAQYGSQPVWLGDQSRVYIRKAQYHYGWDWGPCLLTPGPWKAVRLEAYSARLSDLHCPVELDSTLEKATLSVQLKVEADHIKQDLTQTDLLKELKVQLRLLNSQGEMVFDKNFPIDNKHLEQTISIENPDLWWPRLHGAQPRYKLNVTLCYGNQELDQTQLTLGIRRLRLLQEPVEGETGTSFVFEINNQPVFCGGANWIPADSFLPRLDYNHYRILLEQSADANMTMLRVWGGGIYESDWFYDICDELGILVWQDFMFACGLYPAADWFVESVQAEVQAALVRLRHHACIVLWCGNNEDYMLAQTLDYYQPELAVEQGTHESGSNPFPARLIYEQLLPQLCARFDSTRPYWASSPYGTAPGSKVDVQDSTVGDRHTWEVWHHQKANYKDYAKFGGRFISEFGVQSLPIVPTLEEFLADNERFVQSQSLEFHNKEASGNRTLALYLADTIQTPSELDRYAYATQFVQSEALASAVRGWRRKWNGTARASTAGALVWQLNDCWPGISWSLIDYYLRPKPAYYTFKRELAPLTVNLDIQSSNLASVWCVNDLKKPIEGVLHLSWWQLDGTNISNLSREFHLDYEGASEIDQVKFSTEEKLVLFARLIVDNHVVARASLWPEPFKYLHLFDPEIDMVYLDDETIRLTAKKPAKGVFLWSETSVKWSDNMLDLMPGESQLIKVAGLGKNPIHLQYLCQPFR